MKNSTFSNTDCTPLTFEALEKTIEDLEKLKSPYTINLLLHVYWKPNAKTRQEIYEVLSNEEKEFLSFLAYWRW